MNMWQALFSRKKSLSPRKRHKKYTSMGWQGWTVTIGAIILGAALAILMSHLASKQDPVNQPPAEKPAPAETQSDG